MSESVVVTLDGRVHDADRPLLFADDLAAGDDSVGSGGAGCLGGVGRGDADEREAPDEKGAVQALFKE